MILFDFSIVKNFVRNNSSYGYYEEWKYFWAASDRVK